MKRFEAIEDEIEYLEILNSSDNKQLLSELKQIRDEHSEMVELIKRTVSFLALGESVPNHLLHEMEDFLTKINDK